MNYTPAPWEYPNGLGIKASGQPLQVAGRTKRAIANRALVADAPVLLDALKVARDRINVLGGNTDAITSLLKKHGVNP